LSEELVLTLDEFLDYPAEARLELYKGIAFTVAIDVRSVSDGSLKLLSYGMFRDTEAFAMAEAEGTEKLLQWPDVSQAVLDQGDDKALRLLGDEDLGRAEGLQVPVTAAAIVLSVYGGTMALGAGGVGTGGVGGAAGAAMGAGNVARAVATATGPAAAAGKPALLIAARLLGMLPSALIKRILIGGSAAVGVVGTPLLFVSIRDNVQNYDENEIARLDVIAEAQQPLATWEERPAWEGRASGTQEGIYALGEGPEGLPNPFTGFQATQAQTDRSEVEDVPEDATTSTTTPSGDPFTTGVGADLPSFENYENETEEDPFVRVDKDYLRLKISTAMPGVPDIDWLIERGMLDPVRDAELIRRARQDMDPFESEVGPRYKESDIQGIAARLTGPKIYEIQQEMIRAGLIDPEDTTLVGPFIMGKWDRLTERAFEHTLGQANVDGETWQVSLTHMARAGDRRAAAEEEDRIQDELDRLGPYIAPVRVNADYATLATDVEEAIRRKLGRKPNDWEMELLTDQMQASYRARNNQEAASARGIYDAQVRAIETGEDQAAGSVIDVDPAARFEQTFNDRFESELARRDKTIDAERRTDTLMAGLENAMGAI
jgi:hypothetical protein